MIIDEPDEASQKNGKCFAIAGRGIHDPRFPCQYPFPCLLLVFKRLPVL
jgi:hypothetical protein